MLVGFSSLAFLSDIQKGSLNPHKAEQVLRVTIEIAVAIPWTWDWASIGPTVSTKFCAPPQLEVGSEDGDGQMPATPFQLS